MSQGCHQGCGITPPCATQEEMTRNHGYPAEFRLACAGAIGEISLDEYEAATRLYEREWCAAGRVPICAGCDGSGWQKGENEGFICDVCDRACVCRASRNPECLVHQG